MSSTSSAAEPPSGVAVNIERRNADRVAISAGLEPGEKVALEDPTLETRQ